MAMLNSQRVVYVYSDYSYLLLFEYCEYVRPHFYGHHWCCFNDSSAPIEFQFLPAYQI
jgi:hypothetical protein